MKKQKMAKDTMEQKLKNAAKTGKRMEQYAAVTPLLLVKPVGHDLKEMGGVQDEFFRSCDAFFKNEQ